MSLLQAQTISFESTTNNYVRYYGSNSYIFSAGGANVMTVNTTAVTFPLGLSLANLSVGNTTANITSNTTTLRVANAIGQTVLTPTSLFVGNSSVNCVINSTSIYFNGIDYNPTTALAIAVALS